MNLTQCMYYYLGIIAFVQSKQKPIGHKSKPEEEEQFEVDNRQIKMRGCVSDHESLCAIDQFQNNFA